MGIGSILHCASSNAEVDLMQIKGELPGQNVNTLDSLLELLPQEIKAEVFNTLEHLSDKFFVMPQVYNLAVTRNYKRHRELFLNENFEYYALAAVQDGVLTPMQFGTLMFVRAALEEPISLEELSVQPLFEGECISDVAREAITETLKVFDQKIPAANQQEMDRFFQLARNLPESEKFFVYFPYEFDIHKRGHNGKRDVFIQLVYAAQFNIFGSTHIEGRKVRMIPSFGMVQAFLCATGGEGYSFKPRIGYSTAESIHRSMSVDNAREVIIHCPRIAPAPNVADRYSATPLSFMYHDLLYHAYVCGLIPAGDRRFYCDLAKKIRDWPSILTNEIKEIFEHVDENPLTKIVQKIYELIVDMEFSRYRIVDSTIDWNLDEKRERTMYRICDILDSELFKVPASLAVHEYAKVVFSQLKGDLIGFFGVWMLYKQNYRKFSEIAKYLDSFRSLEREIFIKNVREILFFNSRAARSLIPVKFLRTIPSEKLTEVVSLKNMNFYGIEKLNFLGVKFKDLWSFPPVVRKIAVRDPELFINLALRLFGTERHVKENQR